MTKNNVKCGCRFCTSRCSDLMVLERLTWVLGYSLEQKHAGIFPQRMLQLDLPGPPPQSCDLYEVKLKNERKFPFFLVLNSWQKAPTGFSGISDPPSFAFESFSVRHHQVYYLYLGLLRRKAEKENFF